MQRCYGCMKEYGKEYDVCPYCGYIVGTKPESKSHLLPGTILAGRYTVGRAIGHGGFGITYIALDNKIRKIVAVKEYFPNAFSTRSEGDTQVSCFSSESERFLKDGIRKMLDEARRVSRFSQNENIVDIYDFFEANNTAYIVMEYLDGKNLKQYLEENGGKLAPKKAVELILPVLNALEDMHKEHLIHRDISPDNIYLCDNGKVKLLDFGSARLASEDSEKSLSVMLKRGFAPKEQYSSRSKQGAWTDVYAVCATLYKMITGETPVESTDRDDEELKSFSELGVNGCDELEKIILKGMAIKPADRIQSVQELRAQLIVANKSEAEKEPEKQENQQQKKLKKPVNKKIIVAVAVVVIVAIAAVFGVKYFKDKTETVGQSALSDTTEATTLVPMQVIPDVIGYEYAKAEKALKDLGFEVVKETVENDDASKTGTIKEIKDIKAGEQYPEGATVTLLECGEPASKEETVTTEAPVLPVMTKTASYKVRLQDGISTQIEFRPLQSGYYGFRSKENTADVAIKLLDKNGNVIDEDRDSVGETEFLAFAQCDSNSSIIISIYSENPAPTQDQISFSVYSMTDAEAEAVKKYREYSRNGVTLTDEDKLHIIHDKASQAYHYPTGAKGLPVDFYIDGANNTLWLAFKARVSGSSATLWYPVELKAEATTKATTTAKPESTSKAAQ